MDVRVHGKKYGIYLRRTCEKTNGDGKKIRSSPHKGWGNIIILDSRLAKQETQNT